MRKKYFSANYLEAMDFNPGVYSYPTLQVDIDIYKDELTNKFYYVEEGIESSPWVEKKEFNLFEDAINYFTEIYKGFYLFKVIEIHESKKEMYLKKVIEKLNIHQHNKIDKIPNEFYRNNFKVELVLAHNKGNMNIIEIHKNNNFSNENTTTTFVGKLDVQGSLLTIKNENDEIVFLTSSENTTVNIEKIKNDFFWYYKSIK